MIGSMFDPAAKGGLATTRQGTDTDQLQTIFDVGLFDSGEQGKSQGRDPGVIDRNGPTIPHQVHTTTGLPVVPPTLGIGPTQQLKQGIPPEWCWRPTVKIQA